MTFSVQPEFSVPGVDPQVATQLLQAAMAGKISNDTYWHYITTGKFPEHDYDFEALRIENPGGIIDEQE